MGESTSQVERETKWLCEKAGCDAVYLEKNTPAANC